MKYKSKQKGFTLIELITVVFIIAILMATSMRYYTVLLEDAQKAGVNTLARRFAAVTSQLHLKWAIVGKPTQIALDDAIILFNADGWPMGAITPYIDKKLGPCQQLWEALFKNSSELPDHLPADRRGIQYWSSRPQTSVCRYQLVMKSSDQHYFDYFLLSGRVKTMVN
jgi:prepilin-type N-terminal cleavage/methylation domain-containing protein